MNVTKKERNKISKWLWIAGTGSKGRLAEKLGFDQSELTRLLKGGTISEDKLKAILKAIKE